MSTPDEMTTVLQRDAEYDAEHIELLRATLSERLLSRRLPPRTIGPYVIRRPLGRGGFGFVHEAEDPRLGRTVALKLVTRRDGADEVRMAEARALAKIRHPNVVPIFDVGDTPDGGVYIVMELVDGVTLEVWVKTQRPDWRTIVDVFVQAGRGLEAVHHHGFVHGDFKPSNVMLDASGVARVLDFGLARPHVAGGAELFGGTRGYMAPELDHGARPHAGADQWAFCRALSVALVESASPRIVRVPGSLRRTLARGLADDPAQRFASMQPLVDRLERIARPRRSLVGVSLAGGAAAAMTVAALHTGTPHDACAELDVDGPWTAEAREAVRAGVLASQRPYAERVWTHVASRLDDEAARIVDAARASCRAAVSSGRHDDTTCVATRMAEFEAVVDVLRDPPVDPAAIAVQLVAELEPTRSCPASPMRTAEHELDVEAAAQVWRELAQAHAFVVAGDLRAARAPLQRAQEAAERTESASLRARAKLRAAELERLLGDPEAALLLYRDAAASAERIGDDPLAIRALHRMARVLVLDLARVDEGSGWLELADAKLARVPPDVPMQADAAYYRGVVRHGQGRLDEAAHELERAAELRAQTLGADHPATLGAEAGLAKVLADSGRREQAADRQRATMARISDTLGPDHPLAIMAVLNFASMIDDLEETSRLTADAHARSLATMGASHPMTLLLEANLGWLALLRGDEADAVARLEQVVQRYADRPADADRRRAEANLEVARVGAHAQRSLDEVRSLRSTDRARADRIARDALASVEPHPALAGLARELAAEGSR